MFARPRVIGGTTGRGFFVTTLTITASTFLAGLLIVDPLGAPAAPAPASGPDISPGAWDDDPGVPHDIRFDQHIEGALDWLARHQFADGSWGAQTFSTTCDGRFCMGRGSAEHDIGVTALATLAFVESGLLDRRNFREAARKGSRWLADRALDPHSGRFGASAGKYMYDQALATLALSRAYDVLGDPSLPGRIRRGADFLWSARNPGRVWRYDVQAGSNDTSVTGWAVEALLASRSSEARFDAGLLVRDTLAWVGSVTNRSGLVGYSRVGVGSAVQPGVNDRYQQNETLAAVAARLRIACGQDPRSAELQTAVSRLMNDLPYWGDGGTTVDFNYWHQGTAALQAVRHQYPRQWTKWSERTARLLVKHQRGFLVDSPCLQGSWDPMDKWGHEGGRIYATALNALTLTQVWKTLPPPEPEEE